MKIINREHWLTLLAKKLETQLFKPLGHQMPAQWRVTCGFPSKGGLGHSKRTIGQNWAPHCSSDETTEIIISITLEDQMEIAGVLAHEMIHSILGNQEGHGKNFRKLALAIGLTGKMTATTTGEAFEAAVAPLLKALGKYPHRKLDSTQRKVEGTRMVKVSCPDCGYTLRTTRKWIAVAVPACPNECCDSYMHEMQVG